HSCRFIVDCKIALIQHAVLNPSPKIEKYAKQR
ncbi:MAG: hypothetical protein ACI85I_002572, partial [Arenicella sp.]